MLQHQVKRIRPSLFAKIRQQCNVAAEDGLQTCADSTEYRAGAHHDTADNSQGSNHAISVEFKLRGHHVVSNYRCRCALRQTHRILLLFCRYSNSAVITKSCSAESYSMCSTFGLQQTWQSST